MEEGDVVETVVEDVVDERDESDEGEREVEFDLDEAVKQGLRKAIVTDTIYRGLREAVRVLEREQALFVVLAKDCDHPEYSKLVEALCNEHRTNLVRVPQRIQLGEWAGLCTYDEEGKARKTVACSCVVVHKDVEKEAHPAITWLLAHFKSAE